jgi:hypothetical protein
MLLRLRMDWRGGEHGKKSARESGGLSRERPDIARDATDRTSLPKLAEPSGEPSERLTVAETSRNPGFVRVLAGMALRVGEQNGKDAKDDCGLTPKHLGELRAETDRKVSSDEQSERGFGW